MARVVSVSDVRRALYWAAGGPEGAGSGEAGAALLGTLFHRLFADLTGADSRINLVRPLEASDPDLAHWKATLRRHAYTWHIAPGLADHAGGLHDKTAQVLTFWTAVQELCGWLAELMWAQREAGRGVEDARAAIFVAHETEVSREINEPGWTEPVTLTGRIDAVLRQPTFGISCLVELKTGRAAPEADLCQAALYHLLHGEPHGRDEVAVVGFQPEPHEHRVAAARLGEALAALQAVVGHLAGVIPGAPPAPPAPPPVSPLAPDHEDLRRRLIEAYGEFGVALAVHGPPLVGPTFLRFFADSGKGVRPRQVEQLTESVWHRLRTNQPPQVSIQQGRIALDVERPDRQVVPWSSLDRSGGAPSRFPLGVAVDGRVHWADLSLPEHAHFLVAGTTGSGKSEWLRAVLASLLVLPSVRLCLIDPKRVAFAGFEGARVLWQPVVYDAESAITLLDDLIAEMERRYERLSAAGVQNLDALVASGGDAFPRIVCFCDEYADLVADRKARKDLESRVARLGGKARAAGIHLVFATQRPSRDVVSGTIKANLVARVALRVTSALESRIVVERPGAETLLGRGDLLFKGAGDPVRLQSPFVTEDELRARLG